MMATSPGHALQARPQVTARPGRNGAAFHPGSMSVAPVEWALPRMAKKANKSQLSLLDVGLVPRPSVRPPPAPEVPEIPVESRQVAPSAPTHAQTSELAVAQSQPAKLEPLSASAE